MGHIRHRLEQRTAPQQLQRLTVLLRCELAHVITQQLVPAMSSVCPIVCPSPGLPPATCRQHMPSTHQWCKELEEPTMCEVQTASSRTGCPVPERAIATEQCVYVSFSGLDRAGENHGQRQFRALNVNLNTTNASCAFKGISSVMRTHANV